MTHDFCRDHLGEYLDQSLDQNERAKVEAHLENCADCAQVAREMGDIRTAMREMTPFTAPVMLRQNVRSALQAESKSRALRSRFRLGLPQFAWRSPQLAWSAPLAVAAVALLVLARPFTNAPLSNPETQASGDSSTRARDVAGAAPATVAPIARKRPRPATLKRSSEKERDVGSTTSRGVSGRVVSEREPEKLAEKKFAVPEPNATTTGLQADSAPSSAASLLRQRSHARAINAAPQFRVNRSPLDSLTSQSPGSAPSTSAPPLAHIPPLQKRFSSASPTAALPLPKTELDAITPAAITPAAMRSRIAARSVKPLLRQDDAAALPQEARDAAEGQILKPLFSMQLRGVPVPLAALPKGTVANSASATMAIPPAMSARSESSARGGAPRTAPPRQDEAHKPNAPVASATKSDSADATTALSGLAAPMMRARVAPAPDAAKPDAGAIASTSIGAFSSGVRRFSLQIQTATAVKNARIRLEIAPPGQLLWPLSPLVWRGDLAPTNPVQIAFSLAGIRGGEKISVVVEQIQGNAQPTRVETQTLVLPPTP